MNLNTKWEVKDVSGYTTVCSFDEGQFHIAISQTERWLILDSGTPTYSINNNAMYVLSLLPATPEGYQPYVNWKQSKDTDSNNILVTLTDRQYKVLDKIASMQELTLEQVLIQGLKLYQLFVETDNIIVQSPFSGSIIKD